MRTPAADGLVRATVCTLERLSPTGPAACGDAGLQRVQTDVRPKANHPEIERQLRDHERLLNEYYAAVRPDHRRPQVDIETWNGISRGTGFVIYPPSREAAGDSARIYLHLGDSGAVETNRAEAIFALAHLFGQIAQWSYTAQRDPRDELRGGVDILAATCDGRACEPIRQMMLRADCMAGAYLAWAGIDTATLGRIRSLLAARTAGALGMLPTGARRLQAFDAGFEAGRTTSDPYQACPAAVS
jgi:hypothetical protein